MKCSENSVVLWVDKRNRLISFFLLLRFRSQSYQTFIFPVFRILLLSLSVWKRGKNMYLWEMVKLISIKTKKIFVYEEKKFGRIDCTVFFAFSSQSRSSKNRFIWSSSSTQKSWPPLRPFQLQFYCFLESIL